MSDVREAWLALRRSPSVGVTGDATGWKDGGALGGVEAKPWAGPAKSCGVGGELVSSNETRRDPAHTWRCKAT